jgi:drug/metabolite transporter (DMT)-like permease
VTPRPANQKRKTARKDAVNRRGSLVAVVISAACFGTLAVLAPLAYAAGAQPLPLLAWRFLFAAILLAVVVAVRKPSDLLISGGDFARYATLALTGYGAASICFFFALKFADASVVGVLLYAYPALVTVASWVFLGERATWQRGLSVVVTFAGCALVVGLLGGPARVSLPGILLGLGAAVGYTLFNLLSDRWLPGRSQLVMMGYTFGIAAVGAAVVSIGIALVQLRTTAGGIAEKTAQAVGSLSPAMWESRAWVLLGVIVLVPTFIAVVLYLQGIRGLGPSQAAVISTLEPLFTIALARVFLHERLVAVQWIGALLVLAGVVFAETSARRIEQPAAF